MAEKMKIVYLQETDFRLQMKEVVEPYLQKYKKNAWFRGYGGRKIFYSSYVKKDARGCIVISHGFSEFAEKYNEVVFYFLQAGYSVFIPEHRGHGHSERSVKNQDKIYVKSFEEYVWDLRIFVKKIIVPYHKQNILFAHSMGGAIGALYLEKYPADFQKAILSSPMIQMRVGNFPYQAAMYIAHLCTAIGLGRSYAAGQHGFTEQLCFEKSSSLSRERCLYAFEKRLHNSCYRTHGAANAWVSAAGKAAVYVQDEKNIQKIKIPVLIFAAGREHMVNTDEICRFASNLKNARLVWLLQSKHEPFNAKEQARLQFYDEIFQYLLIP